MQPNQSSDFTSPQVAEEQPPSKEALLMSPEVSDPLKLIKEINVA
jgi:hypothetical protein